MKTSQDHMRRAIELSRIAMDSNQGGPFGAVIVLKGEVVGEGHNCVFSANDPTAHGEIVAIRDATARLKTFSLAGAEIYTSCEPCPMCLGAIYWAGISRIYYGNSIYDANAVGFSDVLTFDEMAKPAEQRQLPAEQFLREEAQDVFKDWAVKQERKPY